MTNYKIISSFVIITGLRVLQFKVFIGKLVPIDGLAPRAVALDEIAALAHELWDDAMKLGSFVAEATLSCGQDSEILGRPWYDISP